MNKRHPAPGGPSEAAADIVRLRADIDRIDAQVLELINQRLCLVQQIGRLKAEADLPVVDNGREAAVMERLERLNPGPLQTDSLRRLFGDLIRICREIQAADPNAGTHDIFG